MKSCGMLSLLLHGEFLGPLLPSPSRYLPVGARAGEPVEDARRCMETAGLPPKKYGLQVASMNAEPGHQFF